MCSYTIEKQRIGLSRDQLDYIPLKVRRGPLGLSVGTYGPLECSGEFLRPS